VPRERNEQEERHSRGNDLGNAVEASEHSGEVCVENEEEDEDGSFGDGGARRHESRSIFRPNAGRGDRCAAIRHPLTSGAPWGEVDAHLSLESCVVRRELTVQLG
jgi:hypothetical protein